MSVTIKEIAAAAGVSRGTVDRVLHHRSGVNPDVAAHVREIANQMGYLPNRAGKFLAARKNPVTIGCMLPSLGNTFFDDVIRGFRKAEEEFRDFGLSVVVEEVAGFDVQTHLNAIARLEHRGISALCLSSVDVPEIREQVDRLMESGIPVVAVNSDLSGTKRLCYVGSDYLRSGRTAAGLLSMLTNEALNILIVTGSMHMKGHNERIYGFQQVLWEKGVSHSIVGPIEALDDNERAFVLTKEALRENPEVNAVYITAAGVSGAERALRQLAKRPLVIGFDDIPATKELVRQGRIDFTICQEPIMQGYKAIQCLFDYFMQDQKTDPQDYFTDTVIKMKENI